LPREFAFLEEDETGMRPRLFELDGVLRKAGAGEPLILPYRGYRPHRNLSGQLPNLSTLNSQNAVYPALL